MPTTRRTKGVVLAPVRDDPMPRKTRSRATSVASSQRSNDDRHHHNASVPAVVSRLASHNEELISENHDLRQELERQKNKRWTIRDQHLAEQLAEYHAQHSKPEKNNTTQEKPSDAQTEEPVQKEPAPQSSTEELSQAVTPAKTRTVPLASTPEEPATVPKWRQFLSTIGGFSPFPRRSATPKTVPEKPAPQEPLGELPPNRKRPAPEADDTPTKKAKTPEPEVAQQTTTQQPQSAQEAPRDTTATPTRASKKTFPHTEKPTRAAKEPEVMAPGSTPRRRTIRDVRAAKMARTPLPNSALRKYEAPIKPKEPNADKRLARMQELEKLLAEKKRMEEQIARLAAEQEADGIDTRKRKRVKVDELAYIPHNDPGDAEGTFKVPDWDSDDEMEVDDEVPLRPNVFSLNAERQSGAPQPVKSTASPQKAAATPLKPSSFPSKSLFSQAAPSPVPPKSLFPQRAPVDASSIPAKSLFSQPAPPAQSLAPPKSLSAGTEQAKAATSPATSQTTSASHETPSASLFDVPAAVAPATKSNNIFKWPVVGAKGADAPEAERIAASHKFDTRLNNWLVAA